MAHYKTKFNQSYLYNNLPRTLIDFLKHEKKLRSFIKEVNRNNNLYNIIKSIELNSNMNDLALTKYIINHLVDNKVKVYNILNPYTDYLYKYKRKIYDDYMAGNINFMLRSEYDRIVNNVKYLIKTFKQ